MIIDSKLLDEVTKEAKESSRLRMNRDMRNSSSDKSQRMLNALEPGTLLPIHRHRGSTETIVILRGHAVQYLYDDNGNETNRVYLKPDSNCIGMNVPLGIWHRIESLESGTVIFEAKDGEYHPLSQEDILSK